MLREIVLDMRRIPPFHQRVYEVARAIEKRLDHPLFTDAYLTGLGATVPAGLVPFTIEAADPRHYVSRLLRRMDACRLPIVARVNGHALAGGFGLVCACDLVVASDDAAFGLPEVTRGLIAAAGGLYRLPRVLPRPVALELILTADTLSAADALRLGWLNRVVPAARVMDEALALARRITRNAPVAVRESLQIARQAADLDEAQLRTLSLQARKRVQATEDYREGPRAFIEKRPPRWSGR